MNKLRAQILLFTSLVIFSLFIHYCSGNVKAAESKYDWLDKINEAKQVLRDVELRHSAKIISYKEIRKLPSQESKNKTKTLVIKRTDYAWKETGLALMNTETGEIKIIKIKKEGQRLWNQEKEFLIEIEPRINGLTWNGRNSAFHVVSKPYWVVIGNKWVDLINKKPIESIYVPYSTSLHRDELVQLGGWHLLNDVLEAFKQLNTLGVESFVILDRKISEIPPFSFPYNLVLVELTDPRILRL
ncbi:MAG: hypothetical protein HYX20_02050 [Candidatus Yanofskybacteria bacterium]|nr:hypothetical protein [Candidatus Yanofskybacteria bacterium]